MNYPNKRTRLDEIKKVIDGNTEDLHPTDKAEALRELETFSGKRAAQQEEFNDKQGVPERPIDQPEDIRADRPGVEL